MSETSELDSPWSLWHEWCRFTSDFISCLISDLPTEEDCDNSEVDRESKVNALVMNHSKGNYMCKICCYTACRPSQVKTHILRRHLEIEPTFHCTLCSKSFLVANDRQTHYKRAHQVNLTSKQIEELAKPQWNCYTCSWKSFRVLFQIYQHMMILRQWLSLSQWSIVQEGICARNVAMWACSAMSKLTLCVAIWECNGVSSALCVKKHLLRPMIGKSITEEFTMLLSHPNKLRSLNSPKISR